MDGTLDFANVHWERAFNPNKLLEVKATNNATKSHSILVKLKKIPF